MDIDLLFTDQGDAGLISNRNLVRKVAGVLFETGTGVLSFEYIDQSQQDLNIPIEEEFHPMLDMCAQIHIGAVQNGQISQAYQVPLLFVDDPYRAEMLIGPVSSIHPLGEFAAFMARCINGQPANRDDLGNEDTMGCILDETSRSTLEFAPHLLRRHALENAPRTIPVNVPQFGMPGLDTSGSSGGYASYQRSPATRDQRNQSKRNKKKK